VSTARGGGALERLEAGEVRDHRLGERAGRTGVVVVAPHATDLPGAVDQHKIVDPGLLQPHRGRDAAEAGPDDRDMVVRNGHDWVSRGWR
jgi:hypothetical protein